LKAPKVLNNNSEIVQYLINIGIKQIVGVLGSGDSYKLVETFVQKGGEFLEAPTEFSSPIIASSINKLWDNKAFAASISIRGPGLVSSLPGLYHNQTEDLNSFSISESLSNSELNYNSHKIFDLDNALLSLGLQKYKGSNVIKTLESKFNSSINPENYFFHFTTRGQYFYQYKRSINEMCNNRKKIPKSSSRSLVFVIGKRGIEYLIKNHDILLHVPFFLTPAALSLVDLNNHNFLGVWTGNEQFKAYLSDSNLLDNSIIIRVGVMKRELLTLKEKLPHYDFPLNSRNNYLNFMEILDGIKFNPQHSEKSKLETFRKDLAERSGTWSTYTVISIINSLKLDVNYCFDVGSFATIIENYIRPLRLGRLHSAFIGKFMGTAVPISMGVSMAEPSTPVLCMLGEGGFSSSSNEIAAIANLNLPVCILVFANGSMHSIVGPKMLDDKVSNKFFPPNYFSLEKTKIPNLPTYQVNSAKQFEVAISNWSKKSPILIFLKFSPESYAKGVESLR